jgi:opacity protein-like surface antigen
MKKTLILLTALILTIPGFVFSDLVTFKIGYFLPNGAKYDLNNPRPDDLWWIEFDQMNFNTSSYQTANFGFSYEYFFSNNLSLVLSIDTYSKNKMGQYLDYVGLADFDGNWAYPIEFSQDIHPDQRFFPSHSCNVSITPFQLSVKIAPLGRRMKIIPYIGGGVGIYLWNVRLLGDYIDFEIAWEDLEWEVDIFPIGYVDAREENKLKVGFQGFAGIMIPLANRLSLEAEFKYNYAMADFTEAFQGFEPFDLSGYQISIGMNYWF